MIPSLKPLQPLLQTSTLPWGSRSRPRHALQIQPYRFHGSESKKEEYSYIETNRPRQSSKRKGLLRAWKFPRVNPYKRMPTIDKLWCTMKRIPQLLSIIWVAHSSSRRRKNDSQVKSHIGNYFYDLVTQDECLQFINETIHPWGRLSILTGKSMEPTYIAPQVGYARYVYEDSRDITLGDVVSVLNPDEKGSFILKRVAGLGGDRIQINTRNVKQIINIPAGKWFALGDNPPESTDSRDYGPLPIEAIWRKHIWQWGPNGFQWIDHERRPWLKSKVIIHLKPGQPPQATDSDRSHSTKNLRKQPVAILRPPPPPPLRRRLGRNR